MGYEIKAVVGVRYRRLGDGWISEIARIDLCKVGYGAISRLDEDPQWKSEDSFFYADDGNTKVTKDLYDNPIRVIPLRVVLLAAKERCRKGNYRRFEVFYQLLKSIETNFSAEAEADELVVAFYGY